MFSSDYKHFNKEFRTKFKTFSFSLVDRGSVIRITEWRKTGHYSIKVDLGGADWNREFVHSILKINQVDEFKWFYRTHNYRLILECERNRAGRFLKICMVQNGTLNYLFIPEEINCHGWRNFCYCLDSFFVTKYDKYKERMGFLLKKRCHDGSKGAECNYGENIKSQPAVKKQMEVINLKTECVEVDQYRKDWRKALVVYRNTMMISWGEIRKRIQAKLRRAVEVVSLAADRAIFWCLNEDEISSLLLNPVEFSNGRNQVRIEQWNIFAHWDNLQIHVNHSWIGIEGLPINVWNIHVCKIIGKSMGGLLEVAHETTTFSFLQYAMIKVGGLERGFMDPIMEIPCQGLKVSVGIFTIDNPRKLSAGGRTLGLITRAVRAEDDYLGGGERQKEVRIGSAASIQIARPRFVLHSSEKSDMAASRGKVGPAQSYKEILLSAVSEKGGREVDTGLTTDCILPVAHGDFDRRHSRFSQARSIPCAQSLEKMQIANMG